MSAPDTSIVIVSYNTGPILSRCIESALAQEGLREIILVDNGNDETVTKRLDLWAKREPKLSIIRGQGNVGFAAGCNIGASRARGEYLLLLNPDCILPARALTTVAEAMRAHPEAWLAGCCMVNPDGTPQGGSVRNLLTLRVALTEALRLYRISKKHAKTRLNIDETVSDTAKPVIVPAISGAFMLLKRARYHMLGGMDERYFFHVEDLDFCRYIDQQGGKVLYVPTVKCVHFRSTSDVSPAFIERSKSRGFILYFEKHFKGKFAPGIFPLLVAGIRLRLWLRLIQLPLKDRQRRKIAAQERERFLRQTKLLETQLPANEQSRSAIEPSAQPILLTGASGQVGLSIVRQLLSREIETIALYHSSVIDFLHPKLRWIQSDLRHPGLNLQGLTPKTVIHTPPIWMLPPHLENFAALGVKRLICFSSTSITSKSATANPKERDLIRKMATAEEQISQLCQRFGIAWTIFRPTLIYGIGLDRNVSNIVAFIRRFGFFPLYNPGKGLRQPVHVSDLAKAAMDCLGTPETNGKIYVLSGGEALSYREMVKRIFAVMNKRERIIAVPALPLLLDCYALINRRSEINGEVAKRMNTDQSYAHDEATRDFGYTPRKFLEGGLADLGIVL